MPRTAEASGELTAASSCEIPRAAAIASVACPLCGATGRVVRDETIQAFLKPGYADGLLGVERRFCGTRDCAVLYYGADGRVVEKGAAQVRVGAKETEDPVPLCYCFGFTRADVRRQVAERGYSDIPARINAEIRAGRCACEVKNPSGACCLREVKAAVREAMEDGEIVRLIRRMSQANVTWGAPRIRTELAKLGIEVSVCTVAKYMLRRRKPPPPMWRAFPDDHLKGLVALDFFDGQPRWRRRRGPPAARA